MKRQIYYFKLSPFKLTELWNYFECPKVERLCKYFKKFTAYFKDDFQQWNFIGLDTSDTVVLSRAVMAEIEKKRALEDVEFLMLENKKLCLENGQLKSKYQNLYQNFVKMQNEEANIRQQLEGEFSLLKLIIMVFVTKRDQVYN